MKLYQLYSATTIVESNGVKVLTDPWLVGNEYFGSWGMFPKYNFKKEKFNDINYIYISHIHPDHFSVRSMDLLEKNIPVLIHHYKKKFLKKEIEKLGFSVIELENNQEFDLERNLKINVFSSDCSPDICENTLGCPMNANREEQIDSMAVFSDGKNVIVNTNDCPYLIASNTAKMIKKIYGKIDLVLIGYTTASSYPHCFFMDEEKKKIEAENKMLKKLKHAIDYLMIFEPKYFIPFAGRLILTGKNFELNSMRGEPDLEFAFDWLSRNIPKGLSKGVLLNHDEFLDLENGTLSKQYVPEHQDMNSDYMKKMFYRNRFDYEFLKMPEESELCNLIFKANDNFQKKRIERKVNSDINFLIEITNDYSVRISCLGEEPLIVKRQDYDNFQPYLKISADQRLLNLMLKRMINWSIADIGSHMRYERKPDVYKSGIFSLINNLNILCC